MPFDTPHLQLCLDKCSFCSIPSSFICAKCKKVSYCSKSHQQQHWKTHKADCFPLIIKYCEEVGRCLITTRDIQEGEIVLKEAPLISGPHFGRNSPHSGQWPICLACFREVRSTYNCSKCGWPLCGNKCENDIQHKEFECKLFTEKKIQESSLLERKDCNFYEGITLLRILLLKKLHPQKWLQLMDLQSHADNLKETQAYTKLHNSSLYFVKECCGLNFDSAIDHVLGIIGVNAFVNDDVAWFDENTAEIRSGSYLYHFASLPSHSCVPNCSWVIQPNSWIHFMASVPIQAGERINILYTSALMGTRERLECLEESKCFQCNCARCEDPTELGSYFSAVKCGPNCGGYLLPEVLSSWKCNECQLTLNNDRIDNLLQEFDENLELLCNQEQNGFLWIDKLLKFLDFTNLHPNHFKVHDVENTIMEQITLLLSQSSGKAEHCKKIELKWAKVLVDLCNKGIKLLDVIWPGLNKYRGRVLFCLQFGLTIILRQEVGQKKKDIGDYDLRRSNLFKIMELRRQVIQTLKMDGEAVIRNMSVDPPELVYIKRVLLDNIDTQ